MIKEIQIFVCRLSAVTGVKSTCGLPGQSMATKTESHFMVSSKRFNQPQIHAARFLYLQSAVSASEPDNSQLMDDNLFWNSFNHIQ